jgi:replicative DNA helicase
MATREKTGAEVRTPPQDVEAEISVLGSLMLDHDAIYRVADALSAHDFYKSAHREIFEAITDLFARREPVDVLSVGSRLKEKGKLDDIGGSGYLTTLVNAVPTASHVEHYASIVRRKRLLRDLIGASQQIAQLGYQEADNVEELLDEAEQKIFGIAKDSLRQEFFHVKDALEEAWDRIDRLHKGDGALRGVSTGFADMDGYLAGLQKSDLVILAARPSLGKTSLALNIARNVAVEEKKAVGVFSLEMSREQVTDRLIAAEAGVDLWRLRTGKLRADGPENDFERLRDAMGSLSQAPIFIDDVASPTVLELRAKARRLHAQHELGLIVIDYLQLIRGHAKTESRVQEVSEISRALKGLAKELNVPVLALSQLSRGIEMRGPSARPKLSDLRESGSIEQDADVVMFIYREDKAKENTDKTNIAEILIEKHRNGPTGKVELYFSEQSAAFRTLEKHYTEPL